MEKLRNCRLVFLLLSLVPSASSALQFSRYFWKLMAGLGSGHLYYTNSISSFQTKVIRREDGCRERFGVNKYEYTKAINPITGTVDSAILVHPPAERETNSEDKRNKGKLAEYSDTQKRLLADRLYKEQLKVRKAQIKNEMREHDLRINLNPVIREDSRVQLPPQSEDEARHLREIFRVRGLKSLNWTDNKPLRLS